MPLKILVFESDPSFAGELKAELSQLGLDPRVVDDGNAGLIAAASDKPDLILLSIELPRMNGFSVCNKLKKDPALKDVPLIIMSSESSDETFEQHKKLRTRAEDYVHKPIPFGELLEHIRPYVQLEVNGAHHTSDDGMIVDDDIELEEVDEYEDTDELAEPGVRGASPSLGPARVDAEVEAFADSAFDHLLEEGKGVNGGFALGANAGVQLEPIPFESPHRENGVRRPTSRPPSPLFDASSERLRDELVQRTAEGEQLRVEAEQLRVQAEQLREEGARLRAEAERMRAEAASTRAEVWRLEQAAQEDTSREEIARLQRELEELRLRVASPVKASGVSSRDFLDLREALNKKDKDILGLRDQISRKEKELLDASDNHLALEREKADLEDRIALLERDLSAARFAEGSAKADKEQAAKRADDWKGRSEKFKAELDASVVEGAARQTRFEAQLDARDARIGDLEGELAQRNERITALGEQLRHDLEASEERGRAALDDAQRRANEQLQASVREVEVARDRALAQLREEADLTRAAALASREFELNQAHEARTLELSQAHEARTREHERLRSESEGRLSDEIARMNRELESARERFAELERRREQDLEELQQRTAHERSTLETRHADEVRNLVAQHADVSSELAKRTEEREGVVRELGAATQRLDDASARGEQNRLSLERAKNALGTALAQLDEVEARRFA